MDSKRSKPGAIDGLVRPIKEVFGDVKTSSRVYVQMLLVLVLVCSLLTVTVYFIISVKSIKAFNADNFDAKNFILREVDKEEIRDFIRTTTKKPHQTDSIGDDSITAWIAATWRSQGISSVFTNTYDVLLSRPDLDNHNTLIIRDGSGAIVHTTSALQPEEPQFPQEDYEQVLPAFNAYAKSGTVEAEVVYCNYGRREDFAALAQEGITVAGRIALIRYSKLFRGDKQREAERLGAVGVVLFSDPEEVAPEGPNNTYPYSVYAPGGAIQLGALRLQGDLLTPLMPALNWTTRLPVEEADLPGIPVQPIGYNDAYEIISRLSGPVAPEGFQGGLDVEYRTGPGLQDGFTTELTVTNNLALTPITNVVGIIWGDVERDRFVLVGNHHDAWQYGGVDPSSGTAALMEVTRLFARMLNEEGWKPRRTLVFLSWAGEEDGLLGSTEFVEDFAFSLGARSVVYLNLDSVISGSYLFRSKAMPLLYPVMEAVAAMVPNPFKEQVEDGLPSLLDSWLYTSPDPTRPGKPTHGGLGSGSDFRPFMFQLGVPSCDFNFDVAPDEEGLPLYHMAYETYELVAEIMDPHMDVHEAAVRYLGLLALQFATEAVVPLSVKEFAEFTERSVAHLEAAHGEQFDRLDLSLDKLHIMAEEFVSAAVVFQHRLADLNLDNALAVRQASDTILLCSRAMLDARGLPGRPTLWHQLLGPSSVNGYNMEVFPGVEDLLRLNGTMPEKDLTRQLGDHLNNLVYRLHEAKTVLSLNLWRE